MRHTPDTDAELSLYLRHGEAHQVPVTWIEFTRKMERERDEAREQAQRLRVQLNHFWQTNEMAEQAFRERDEAREALADWENASAHVEANHPDEVHCGCVPVLRKLLADSRKERDEARAVAYDLATIASHCLGWHDHETGEAAERISSVLKKWKGEL